MGLKYRSSTAFQACVVQVRLYTDCTGGAGTQGVLLTQSTASPHLPVFPTNEHRMAPAYRLLRQNPAATQPVCL